MYLIFDTETTGLPRDYNAPLTDVDNWPRLVQLAWQCHDDEGNLIEVKNYIVKPEGFTIPFNAEKVHGISTKIAMELGKDLKFVLEEFSKSVSASKFVVGHNVEFDISIVGCEYHRTGMETAFLKTPSICTKEESTDFCALPGGRGGKYKWPNLSELHSKLFGETFQEAHNASADVVATARCFLELIRLNVIPLPKTGLTAEQHKVFLEKNPDIILPIEIEIESHWSGVNNQPDKKETQQTSVDIQDIPFTHLHVHTQYSILDGAADISGLVDKAVKDGMKGLAITDHGNMFGVKDFVNKVSRAKLKPIIGCEFYLARRGMHEKSQKIDGGGDHLILLAKNLEGYHNLLKLVSYSFLDGMYYKPRIDRELLKKYPGGLIALSACLGGEVPRTLMNESVEAAEEVILEYKAIFGDDYYLELQRHQSGNAKKDEDVFERQVYVNQQLIELGKKHNIKYVATNDVHFINAADAEAHDRLVCLNTGKDLDDPDRMRYTRQEWFKTQEEMKTLFADVPEAIETTHEIFNKIEAFSLDRKPIMPDFPLPEGFDNEDDYLRHLTYKGAEERWGENLTDETKERLDFELETIKKMGFPGYFLIVQDFIEAAREMGVSVGPGRGSAAGSAVAYCTKITDVDPIKYDLLFERFLNPDRISMPDIDIDFDEDGREKVMQWVVKKYGKKRVAHIVTFGTMAAKMAIRDVARIEKLPLSDADRLAKLIPEKPGISLTMAYKEVPELLEAKNNGEELVSKTLTYAEILEGSVRQTGIHACGVIIGRDDLEEHIPLCINKDAELYVTQYDGKHVEAVGMLKMDFLGLKTLSIIMDALENIKISKDETIDIDNISLEDEATYKLYARGETTGLFQFESPGMKKHLRALKPNRFGDLIAMNALYRPGPMEYIPSFVSRKHGREKITYGLPEMEEFLAETYGITVYQEQVMRLSQKLAGFTRGQADSLRKAMGKKNVELMNQLKIVFDEGCAKNGHDKKITEKIWNDWKEFAKYAFNKSHSTCYAYISYQTAYLKAHYPAEFMAAVLSRNISDIKKITIFMDECRRMGIEVLGPDVNESHLKFTVNAEGNIRFGLGAIKGVGEAAVQNIVEERKNGPFKNIFDFVERINLQTVNKKNVEALAISGAFDNLGNMKRGQFFAEDSKGNIFIESIMRYGSQVQNEKGNAQQSLFGNTGLQEYTHPEIPKENIWTELMELNKEKDLIGIYLSAHPLDNYRLEIENFTNYSLAELADPEPLKNKDITVAGIVTGVRHAFTKNNKPFGSFTIEDYSDSYGITLFGKDYMTFKSFMAMGYCLLIKGKVQHRFNNENNELELAINSVKLLSEVKEEMISKLSINISSNNLTEEFVRDIKTLASNNQGKVLLKFKVYDPDEKMSIELFSRGTRIELTDEIIDFLEKNDEIDYKVS